ncbi:MAG: GspH/FimT family pseudopilin [Candidatus Nitrotoga sp.]|nr:GspH/FimT family pseudopilin [Candidatus Nitrotoga sp.]
MNSTKNDMRIGVAHRYLGFSLTEAMVTVFIAALLAAAAAPSFTSMIRKIKINSISSALASSLQQARSEAIKLNRPVLVCSKNTAGTDCAASTDWGSNGWIVCYDKDADGACDPSTDTLPNPIRVNSKVAAASAAITGSVAQIRFNPAGASGTGVTVEVQGAAGETARITIAASGLITSSRI